MKLKTYLRGLGLGLIVAALVTGVGSGQPMSDEQVKARAKELGMMESNTYLTQVNESEEAASEEASPEETSPEEAALIEASAAGEETKMPETDLAEKESKESEAESSETESSETGMPENETEETGIEETRSEETKSEEIKPEENQIEENGAEAETKVEQEAITETEYVTFQVRSGDSSVSVANRLAQAGLVGDAKAFDQYLCQNGYDKRIRVGSYKIAHDSSNEEIAKVITGDK